MVIQSFENIETKTVEKQIAEGQNLIRACLFNLIVVSNDPSRVSHCEELIRVVTEKYPCKIIFIHEDRAAQSDFIRVTPGVRAVGNGGSKVHCDLIDIEASSNQFHKIPFLVLPQIVPDLPIYVILSNDPTQQGALLQDIEKHSSRVIYDTGSINSYHYFAERILGLIQGSRTQYVDLNWARTKAWRDALAKAFNNQESFHQLSQSRMIQISYVEPFDKKGTGSEQQAVYLQAWLAAKLKWTLLSVEKEDPYIRISYKYDHTSLTVSLVPKDTEILPPGAIFSFEAMTQGDYHFLIAHENDNKLVRVHASNPDRCEMPYTIFLANYQNGPALVNEVFYQPIGTHYLDMMQFLARQEWE
jgi:glucose-6-phosphate dehydrogenase assembly protein OpcA